MTLTRPFAGITGADLQLAGGKGANLGAMVQAGLPVPPGFVLLTGAYRLFVQQAGIQAEIERLAAAVDTGSPESLDDASARIRALFDQHSLPPEVAGAITSAYEALGAGPVAVRSSATAEDLPGASFAGQQETYLNIEGAGQVVQAVKRCWSSLWTGRALAYRARSGIAPGDVALAVVVQQLVAAEAAGVLFTADPISGRRDRVVIDGAWGLGEAVVSGSVSPDHWLADGATGAIIAEKVGTKTVMTVRVAGGTEERPVPTELQGKPVLDHGQVAALVALGRKTAAHFGAPQDIEWALAGGRFYLLQSRPITTLFPLPAPPPPPGAGLRVYMSMGPFQGVMEPLTPAGISAFGVIAGTLARVLGLQAVAGAPSIFAVAARRIYIDVTAIVRTKAGSTRLENLDAGSARAVRDLQARDERLRPAAGGGRVPLRGISKRVLLTVLGRVLAALANPERARANARRKVEAYVDSLEEASHRLSGLSERLRFVRGALASAFAAVPLRTAPVFVAGLAARSLAAKKLQSWGYAPAVLDPVGRSLAHNPTTEMDLALWRLSRTLLAEGAAPRAEHPAVQAFLEQYGHRAVREIDPGIPRWREQPEPVLQMLANYLEAGAADAEQHFAQGATAAEAAIGAITAQVRRQQGAGKAALVRFLLRRFRQLAGVREWHKFYLVRVFAIVRGVLREAGAELVRAGQLDDADDVFFLEFADLESLRDLRDLAARNRADYARELQRRLVPPVVTSEGEVSFGVPPAAEGMLVGTGASAGVYEGVVHVVLSPLGARLEPGEVLVAPGTDPAWTPLFLTAGALVTETGGMISHGSVVAREYGIPAVVGVSEATTRLRTGQRVRVDGGAGTVVVLE